MEIIGYLASVLIGISLGLIGGGGSILTVPVLVYLFAIEPAQATSYSLFVVGSTSLIGAFKNYRQNQLSFKTAILFGLSSIITVFISRKFIIPLIPTTLVNIGGFALTKSVLTMVLFALLMLIAAYFMISRKNNAIVLSSGKTPVLKLSLYGFGVGLVTGFLGAGGGFILIPALVFLLGLPMKKAIGTSLLIIALNSLFGFLGDIGQVDFDWSFLFKITALAVVGIIAGTALSSKIQGEQLKKAFGWFVMVMGVFILVKELFF